MFYILCIACDSGRWLVLFQIKANNLFVLVYQLDIEFSSSYPYRPSVGLGNGLGENRHQATTWDNVLYY